MRWSTPQPWSTWIAQLLKAHTRVIKDTCQTCKLSPKATTFTREIQLLNKTVDSLVKSLPSTGIQEPKYTSKTPSSFSQLSCPSCMLQCAHQKLPQLLWRMRDNSKKAQRAKSQLVAQAPILESLQASRLVLDTIALLIVSIVVRQDNAKPLLSVRCTGHRQEPFLLAQVKNSCWHLNTWWMRILQLNKWTTSMINSAPIH